MIRRPPRSTRTDTLFPYTTLFRSTRQEAHLRHRRKFLHGPFDPVRRRATVDGDAVFAQPFRRLGEKRAAEFRLLVGLALGPDMAGQVSALTHSLSPGVRSEERRVGPECVSMVSCRWSPLL